MMILKDFWFIWMKNENVKSEFRFASEFCYASQFNTIKNLLFTRRKFTIDTSLFVIWSFFDKFKQS